MKARVTSLKLRDGLGLKSLPDLIVRALVYQNPGLCGGIWERLPGNGGSWANEKRESRPSSLASARAVPLADILNIGFQETFCIKSSTKK